MFHRELANQLPQLIEKRLKDCPIGEKPILTVGIWGVGLSEELVSTTIAVQDVLRQGEWQDAIDYKIVGLNINNPIMERAMAHHDAGQGFPFVYGKEHVPEHCRHLFDDTAEGLVPKPEIAQRVSLEIADITNNQLEPRAFDITVCHNLFQYLDNKDYVSALDNLSRVTATDGKIFLGGDQRIGGYVVDRRSIQDQYDDRITEHRESEQWMYPESRWAR